MNVRKEKYVIEPCHLKANFEYNHKIIHVQWFFIMPKYNVIIGKERGDRRRK